MKTLTQPDGGAWKAGNRGPWAVPVSEPTWKQILYPQWSLQVTAASASVSVLTTADRSWVLLVQDLSGSQILELQKLIINICCLSH